MQDGYTRKLKFMAINNCEQTKYYSAYSSDNDVSDFFLRFFMIT